jgi:hypothetical protein
MSSNVTARFLFPALMLGFLCCHLAAQSNARSPLPNTNDDAAFLTNAPAASTSSVAAVDSNSLIPPPLPKTTDAFVPTDTPKAPSDETVSKTEIKDIALKGPQLDSPFFTERQEAKAAMAEAGREGYGMYVPKPPHPPVRKQVKKFFHDMFGSLNSGKHEATPMIVTLSPASFSLAQTSEFDVTLKLTNAQKKELEVIYPDNQRLEILTKDSAGNIVNRWSQDRSFEPTEGFIAVNPNEFVSYTEHVATSGMKAGETYTIEVSLANQQGFLANITVTPQP